MVKRYNRLLVAFYVITDALLASWAFVLAYGIRFESGLIAAPKGQPPLGNYINVLPFVALLTPLRRAIWSTVILRGPTSSINSVAALRIASRDSSLRGRPGLPFEGMVTTSPLPNFSHQAFCIY